MSQNLEDMPDLPTRQQAATYRLIRVLMGFVQDGSSEVVTMGQDDATLNYYVRVGQNTEYAPTLEGAISQHVLKRTPQ